MVFQHSRSLRSQVDGSPIAKRLQIPRNSIQPVRERDTSLLLEYNSICGSNYRFNDLSFQYVCVYCGGSIVYSNDLSACLLTPFYHYNHYCYWFRFKPGKCINLFSPFLSLSSRSFVIMSLITCNTGSSSPPIFLFLILFSQCNLRRYII